MKNTAYLRISTSTQDLDNQRLAVLDYAHRHCLTINEFVETQISSWKGRRNSDAAIQESFQVINS